MLLSLLQACSQHGNNFSAQKNTAIQEIIHILFIYLPRSTGYKRILFKIRRCDGSVPISTRNMLFGTHSARLKKRKELDTNIKEFKIQNSKNISPRR